MPQGLKSLVKLHSETADLPVAFSYRGPFTDHFTYTILDIYDSTSSAQKSLPTVNRKVSFLLVECFQNILHHGETVAGSTPDYRDDGLFSFRISGDDFIINSINLVNSDEVEDFRKLMEEVNSHDAARLKELYLRQLNENNLSEKGGAGLGLIELARKSGRKVLYRFDEAPGNRMYFHQQVTFCADKDKKEVSDRIAQTLELYEQMTREHSLLCYKGDFSQKAILPILEMVEYNLASGNGFNAQSRKTGHVLIEILQNISKHGGQQNDRSEGIFTIGFQDDRVLLQVGNIVTDREKEFLNEKLLYLRALSKDELKELHRSALRSSLKLESNQKSGLGLIEVAKASTDPLRFEFRTLESSQHLFALEVSI
ncbi:MAG: SiaB family protein kinase [Flavobacteriales bacterium]|jgi:hypothetical protein